MKRKICAVTGSRAEYGLLQPVISLLRDDPRFELQLVVTGMHLSPEFGNTVNVIEYDGFDIADRVESLVSGDTPVAIAKSIALGVSGFADVYRRLQPDWALLLGDRFEIFAAAQAAMVATLPVAHIGGGDTTEGAFDEAIRHSISKMAQLHFVTNEQSARRLVQMGESPLAVHVTGTPGIDAIRQTVWMDRSVLKEDLGIRFFPRNLLITYHPVTLDPRGLTLQLTELLNALDALGPNIGLFFTQPNADPGGSRLTRILDDWVASHPNAAVFTSLGQQRYLSLMKEVDAVVGNSSSGLYEAPSLHIPTVDIGDRQGGRLAAESVIHCEPEMSAIKSAIEAAWQMDVSCVKNPYGDGYAASRIVEAIAAIVEPRELLKKQFHMLSQD